MSTFSELETASARSGNLRSSHDRSAPTLIEQVVAIVRRQWWIIALAVALTAALTVLYASSQSKQYKATASVLFRPDIEAVEGTGRSVVSPEREAATNEALLSLGVVAAGAADRLGGGVTPVQVSEAIEVVPSPEADIVEIRATTGDARLSARMATAYGESFVEFRRAGARERIDDAIRAARNVLGKLTDTQREGQAGTDLRQRLNQLETSRSLETGGVELVQRAETPDAPSSPKPVRSGILGGILGAILGFCIAVIRKGQDRTLRSVDDVERAFGHPAIAQIPRTRALARGDMGSMGGEESESFRMLRASLRYFSVDSELRSVLVASAAPGEGKTTVARRLAETMASMGDSVVLLEADMHRASSFTFGNGGGSDDLGLSTVLIGSDLNDSLSEYVVESVTGEERSLTVLTNGPRPPNPSELLESGRMTDVLVELSSRFDLVIVDSPPLPVLSDALPLVRQVDGVIAVSALGKTTREGARSFLRLVTFHGGKVIGVVVNFAAHADRSAGYYYKRNP